MTARPADTAGAFPRALFHGASTNALMRGAQVCYAPDNGDAGGGGFSIDDAVASLNAHEDEEPAGAGDGDQAGAAAAAAADDTSQSEGETSSPEEAAGAAETPPDGEEAGAEETGAVEPLEPPKYWSTDAKAKFAALDPELQAVVLAQEGPREQATAKAKDEAAQVKAQAEKQLQDVQTFAEELKTFLPQAVQTFRSRWGDNPDWVAYAQQHGAEAMSVAKVAYEAERAELQRVAQATQQADVKAHHAYVAQEFETLKTVAPELADPEKGAERRTEVTKYLQELKIPNDAIVRISAVEMSIARKAMLWDQAQSKAAKPNPAPKPAPSAQRPLARGGAATGPADPKAKAASTAKNRFVQTRSLNDAVALLDAQGE